MNVTAKASTITPITAGRSLDDTNRPAHARDLEVEDHLGDDGAPDEERDVHPKHCDDGRQAGAQAVLHHDLALGKPLARAVRM